MIDRQRAEVHTSKLAIMISYPTRANGITVLLKGPPKYRKIKYNKNASKVTQTLTMFVEFGIMAQNDG